MPAGQCDGARQTGVNCACIVDAQYSDLVLAGEEGHRAELRKHIGVEDLSELMLDGAGMGLVAFDGVAGGMESVHPWEWDKCNDEKCKAVLQWDQYSLGTLEWDQYSLEILEWDQYNRASDP